MNYRQLPIFVYGKFIKTEPNKLSNEGSFLLDFLRLISALTVLIVHAYSLWFPVQFKLSSFSDNLAHVSVVVFFVLSGYVIAYTTSKKKRTISQYAEARLSRLYSVLIPALLITACCQILVSFADPELSKVYSRGASLPRYILSGLFLNEVWFYSAAPPINGVLWSLSYEFWYYVIFGFWFYRDKSWVSYILIFFGCLLAGPKVLLLMPMWLAGCVAARLPKPVSLNQFWFLSAFIAAALLVLFLPPYPFELGSSQLFFAGRFLTDWAVGTAIALSLYLIPNETKSRLNENTVGIFRKIADLTFPIYVLHFPLLILWRSLFSSKTNDFLQMVQAIITVLIISSVIGFLMEKYRPLWGILFRRLFDFMKGIHKPNIY